MDFFPGLSLDHTKDHVILDALFYLPALLAALSFISSLWFTSILATQEGNSSWGVLSAKLSNDIRTLNFHKDHIDGC